MNKTISYRKIVRAIYNKAEKEKSDVRKLIVAWSKIFEESNVAGYYRSDFLDLCVEETERRKNEMP